MNLKMKNEHIWKNIFLHLAKYSRGQFFKKPLFFKLIAYDPL